MNSTEIFQEELHMLDIHSLTCMTGTPLLTYIPSMLTQLVYTTFIRGIPTHQSEQNSLPWKNTRVHSLHTN